MPTRLQLGTSRLENLPPASLRRFLDKTWVHFGDAPDSPSLLRRLVRRARRARNGIGDPAALYEKTTFKTFYFRKGDRLPFEDGSLHFVFSEHFFEHLFYDEAISLLRECHRVLAPRGLIRISVPDADLRSYEGPEPAGFPDPKMPFDHPLKHKTRWSVYMLSETLDLLGFEPHPLRYCDRSGKYVREEPRQYDGCPERELASDIEYLRRPDSLIVDGLKHQ